MTPKVTFPSNSAQNVTLGALLAVVFAIPAFSSTAAAQPPSRLTIVAVFEPITYGENAFVNGQLMGDGQGGQLVTLEQAAPPFTDWAPVAQITSDAAGYYSFKLHPSQTMQYRTNSQGTPSDKPVQVSVSPRITLKAGAAGRSSIRFNGSFAPAIDGQSVAIQRRGSSGAWTTIATARLKGGRTFAGRIRTHKPATLRAFFASDGAHADGFSPAVTARPGAAHAAGSRVRASAAACRTPRVTRVSTYPDPPRAAAAFTLRVRAAAMTGGRVYAIDVRWGVDGQRDHFVLAPLYRASHVTFSLRHLYRAAGTYTAAIRVYAAARGCKASAGVSRRLRVAA